MVEIGHGDEYDTGDLRENAELHETLKVSTVRRREPRKGFLTAAVHRQ